MKRILAFLLLLLLFPAVSAGAEDAAYAHAALFAALLDDQGFAHGEITPYENGAYALAVTCPGGPEGPAGRLESDWYFTADAVHARLRRLYTFDESEAADVLSTLNGLNYDWYLARYAADFSDNTVLVAADALLESTAAEAICADLLDTLLQRAEDAYEALRPLDAPAFAPVPYGRGAEPGTFEDARASAGVFMDMLKSEGIDFTDCGEYDEQYVVESVCPVADGESITSEWIFDGHYVIGAIWNLSSYSAMQYGAALLAVNEQNLTNGALKFIADSSDNSVTAECYQLLPEADCEALLRALYPQLLGLALHARSALD